ncbi:hydrolase [Paenibacillus solisilvae]|uniref:Hydrolase n=1 Tax=Paenibacillus solisilvae TaxID=2486751 RepID=A0ABW0W4P7_9BACL
MIYASDLDQTLIYSTRSMGVPADSPGLIAAEQAEGKTLSYISQEALSLLSRLQTDAIFVPVTTRTIKQYERIHLFQGAIRPAYAIMSNGGNIMVNGIVDELWNRGIRRKVQQGAASAQEARAIFDPIMNEEWVVGERFCDELFFAFVIQRDRMPLEAVLEKAEIARALGWEVSIQGRKIYLVPAAVNKREAIEHIRSMHPGLPLIASGDSILDRCLLDAADYAIAPRHGELYNEQQRNPSCTAYRFTKHSGVFAADEILGYVHEVYRDTRALEDVSR